MYRMCSLTIECVLLGLLNPIEGPELRAAFGDRLFFWLSHFLWNAAALTRLEVPFSPFFSFFLCILFWRTVSLYTYTYTYERDLCVYIHIHAQKRPICVFCFLEDCLFSGLFYSLQKKILFFFNIFKTSVSSPGSPTLPHLKKKIFFSLHSLTRADAHAHTHARARARAHTHTHTHRCSCKARLQPRGTENASFRTPCLSCAYAIAERVWGKGGRAKDEVASGRKEVCTACAGSGTQAHRRVSSH